MFGNFFLVGDVSLAAVISSPIFSIHSKSWHTCGFDDKSASATREILTTKVRKSTYFGEIVNKLIENDYFLGKISPFREILVTFRNPCFLSFKLQSFSGRLKSKPKIYLKLSKLVFKIIFILTKKLQNFTLSI